MKIVKLVFTFCCYGDVNVYVMKMAKLPSPMLASVTMCNDKIVIIIIEIVELGGLGYLTPSRTLKMKRPASNRVV